MYIFMRTYLQWCNHIKLVSTFRHLLASSEIFPLIILFDIAVVDDGRGAAAEVQPTQGHGLLGIRERVEAFGGQIRTGPRVGGGFAVEARIPIESGR